VYQPIVDLKTGEVMGYEALIRWTHPTRGPLSPGEFIPIAEQSALIVDLGGWVLRTATRQLAAWQRTWQDERYVSVNVAASQLSTRALKSQVSAALKESGLGPEHLLLEVTESSLIEDIDDSITQMHQVRALGVRFALDDFGTGYSSLNYLRRFPVDVLKVDKTFIDALNEPEGKLLVRAIINMAASLHLRVVAEGIEHVDQAVELERYDCQLAVDVPSAPRAFTPASGPALRVVS
jgi:EAL domain-containing protein (putative c-di-GMP-specific phosphodiesterase class I)